MLLSSHRKKINITKEKDTEWTLTEEDREALERAERYKAMSYRMFAVIVFLMLLFFFFGCHFVISAEGLEVTRIAMSEEHWRFTLSMFLLIGVAQISILYVIRYQRNEWREGKHNDHMLACYYASMWQVLFLLVYFCRYIRIIK